MKKIIKKLTKVLFFITLFCTVFSLFVGNFIFSFALLRESVFSKDSISRMFSDNKKDSAVYSGTAEEKLSWLEINSQNKYINSDDGIKLHGLYAENVNSNHKYAVVCHGYSSKAAHTSYFAKQLFDMGFSVLAPDARAHGESQGNVRTMGYKDKRDIICWINEIQLADPLAQVVLFGVSMGGATVLFTSGEGDLPACVKAVVSDCAYTGIYEEINHIVKSYAPYVFVYPYIESASLFCKIRGGFFFSDGSCVNAVKNSRTPTLFIHGSADTFVPFYMLDILYTNAKCEKQKLVIDGASHAQSATYNPEVYWNGVKAFIFEHLD